VRSLHLALVAGACAALAAAPALAASPPSPSPFDAALRDGAAAWEARADPARLAEAAAAFARAAALRPGDPAAELPLARAEALRARGDPAIAVRSYRACARAAERALRRAVPAFAAAVDRGDAAAVAAAEVPREAAEPLYRMASCAMGLARARGPVAVLSADAEVRPMMERAAALDASVDRAGPHRALGAWLAALPSAAGGGAGRAAAHFDAARELAPGDLEAKVAEARTLAVLLQDRARFDRLLGEVLAAPARTAEDALARREAEALRARAERLF
jgi:hypothetical protein